MEPPSAGAPPLPAWARWGVPAAALLVLSRRLASAFVLFMRHPMNPDVPGFLSDARGMRWFFDCPTREPFHVLWLKAGLLLSDDGELVARLTTVAQTLLVALLVYRFGCRFFGWLAGATAVLLFAANPVVRFYGVSGLRDPLFGGTMLLFFLLLFSPDPATRRPLQSAAAGLAGALMTLTRVYGYALMAGALVLQALRERAWRRQRRRGFARHLLFCAAAAAALLLPDLLFRPPSPIHGQTVNLFRNIERTGEPGSWQTDPPVGHLQYLFGEHTLVQVVARVTANYARYARQYLPFYMRGYEWLWVFLPIGILAAFLTRRLFTAGLLALSLCHVVFVLNLNQIPGVRGIENRFVYQAFPLALLLALHGLLCLLDAALGAGARYAPSLRRLRSRLAPLLVAPP
jgi:4-amino-4-deoxy-L-arabinose transferase-like glycosyltransferase